MFGSDDEEDAEAEKLKAERVAAYMEKKAAKPKTVAKVRLFPSNYSHPVESCCALLCMYGMSEYDVDYLHIVCLHPGGQALG